MDFNLGERQAGKEQIVEQSIQQIMHLKKVKRLFFKHIDA